MIPILTFDMMGAATSRGLFKSVVSRVALKLRPNCGAAQGVWSRAPARHYLSKEPVFFSGESHTCRTRSHRRCLRGRSWSRSSRSWSSGARVTRQRLPVEDRAFRSAPGTPGFFDYDNDGYLDLFLTNTAHWTTDVFDSATGAYEGKPDLGTLMTTPKEFNILYRNNGDGTFTDVTDRAGLRGRGWAGDAAVFDYDEDGFLDLFVPSMFGRGQLYHNSGHGTFTDVTAQTLGRTPYGAVGCKAFDYDGDGRLDLYVVDMHSDMWMGLDSRHLSLGVATQTQHQRFLSPLGPTVNQAAVGFTKTVREMFATLGEDYDALLFGNALYRNLGHGHFTETAAAAGLETFWPWGVATGDYDNDGNEDVFIPSGMGYPFYYWPNHLMMNNGDGTFRDRADVLGIEPPVGGIYLEERVGGQPAARSSRSAVVADFDGDGRLGIVTNNFNGPPYYFVNRLPRRNYVEFRLTGTTSNRDAIGAVVRLWVGKTVMVRQVSPAGGYLAQSSRVVHFGLGDRTTVDRVEIRWPRGIRQTLQHPEINTLHQIREPAP